MGIISFASAKLQKTSSLSQDWSQQEIADFYRAHRLLVENGAGIGIDRGLSDDGEPWMVFFDATSHDVFLHIARIDGRCLLICEPLNMRLFAADISSLITEFEQSIREYLSVKSDLASNVVVHPAARIIMSISAVFLLVKLDNNQAMAKDSSDLDEIPELVAARAQEKSAIMARGQKATARILELVDSPANVALLAGIILSGVLYSEKSGAAPTDIDETSDVFVNSQIAILELDESTTSSAEANDHQPDGYEVVQKPRSDISNSSAEELASASLPSDEISVQNLFTEGEKFVSWGDDVIQQRKISSNSELLEFGEVQNHSEGTFSAADETILLENDALIVFRKFFNPEGEVFSEVDIADTRDVALLAGDVDNLLGEVSILTLEVIDDLVGLFVATDYDSNKVDSLVEYFSDHIKQYEFGYLGGKILIEELNVEQLEGSQVGLWTNTMNDGSSISVVGNIELIDDVLTFFS